MKIGSTFGDELRAAALGDGIAWDPETGELFFTGVGDADRASALAVLAAHDPTKVSAFEQAAAAVASGYNDPILGVTISITPDSVTEIIAQGTGAGLAISLGKAAGKTYLFPTIGAPYTAPDAQTAYDLAERCRLHVEGLRKLALGL